MAECETRYNSLPENFTLDEKADFDRCVNFMIRMLEKYEDKITDTEENSTPTE